MSHGCHVRVRGCRIGEINHFVKWEVSYLEEGNSTICPATMHLSIKKWKYERVDRTRTKQTTRSLQMQLHAIEDRL